MIHPIPHDQLPISCRVSYPLSNGAPAVLLALCLWLIAAVSSGNAASGGSVVAWGDYHSGQTTVPAGLSGVVALGAGHVHSVALKGDGTVVAWGGNGAGQTNVPADLSGVTGLAAGGFHAVALKSDGTVVTWGAPRPSIGSYYEYGQSIVPAGLRGVRAVAAGYLHTVVLTSNGTVVTWGAGTSVASFPEYGQAIVPPGLTGVTALAAGGYHTVALKSDGTVVVWGAGATSTGQPDFGQAIGPAGLTNVTAIAAGLYHTVALKSDGSVVAWGNGGDGQTTVPEGLTGVTAIAAGESHTLALKRDGTVVAWGNNFDGQTNVPAGLTGATAIAAGGYHSLATGMEAVLPNITVQPQNLVATATSKATFRVTASGPGPDLLAYQWWKNGVGVTDATNASLTLTNVGRADAGSYRVAVSNTIGGVVSTNATLRVLVPQRLRLPLRLPDGSIRLDFGPEDGFVLSLGDTTNLLVQVSANLLVWTNLTNGLVLTGGLVRIDDPESTNQVRRFYRVIENGPPPGP